VATTLQRAPLRWLRGTLVAAPALGAAAGALALLPASPLAAGAAALPLGAGSAGDLLSNAAEVVAAVLAVAITVVAIVVELAATRYTHQITQLFVREPANVSVMALFVATTLLCLWVSAGASPAEAAEGAPAAGAALGLVTLCLVLLLPYFAFVFAYLGPANIIDRLRGQALRGARRAARGRPARGAAELLESVEELEDLALNAIQRSDRGIAVSAAGALAHLLEDYGALRRSLPAPWFRLDGGLAEDPDFVSLDDSERADIAARGTWVEVKVLRQFHTLFGHALNRVHDVPASIAIHTAALARRAARDEPDLLDLALRFLNSYLRSAVNAGDVRTAYYLLHQCRGVLETLLEEGLEERAVRMAGHLRYYGLVAYARDVPFLVETLAYDLALVTEQAFETRSAAAPALLDVLLQVDKEGGSPLQETSLRGVRRAQAQLAARRLARGDAASAERIREDMRGEDRERLASVRDELLAAEEARFWEFTDRAANFSWLPPELRKHVEDFFAGFEPPLPSR